VRLAAWAVPSPKRCSKADAGAKTRRAAELIRRDRYEHLPDYVGSGLADECDRIATQVEQHGRQSSGGLQRELQELIAICEKLYEDYDEDDEATLRLKAVLAWLARIMHHAARFCTSAAEARATAPTD